MDRSGLQIGNVTNIRTVITGNTFRCDANLLPRFINANTGNVTFAGIMSDRQAAVIGLATDPNSQNVFKEIRNGILGNWSVLDIHHIYVEDLASTLPRTTLINPAVVDNFGIRASFSRVSVVNSFMNNVNRGVHLVRNLDYFQERTAIGANVTAIGNINSQGSFRMNDRNSTTADFFGIRNYNSANQTFRVGLTFTTNLNHANFFYASANNPNNVNPLGSAIDVQGFVGGTNANAIKEILQAYPRITTDYNGIKILNDGNYRLIRNDIRYITTPDGSGNGIELNHSSNNRVSLNVALGVGVLPSIGYYNIEGRDNVYCCNAASDIGNGFLFWGTCTGTQLRTSGMTDITYNGLMLYDQNTMISPQVNHSNEWDGSLGANSAYNGAAFGSSSLITRIANTRASEFTVPNPQGTIYFPNQINDNNLNVWFKGDNNSSVKVCDTDPVCMGGFANLRVATIDKVASMLANNSFAQSKYGASTQWQGAKWALENVFKQPEWLGQDANFDHYYSTVFNSNIRRFSDIDALMGSFDTPSAVQNAALALINETSDNYRNEMITQEAAFITNPSNTTLSERRAELLGLRYALLEQQVAINEQIANITAQKVTETQRINESIVPTNLFEQNEQTINRIYLQTLAIGNEDLSEAQKSTVITMANKCPFVDGNAVFKARMLSALFSTTSHFNDKTICGNIPSSPNGGIASKMVHSTKSETSIYPNPASDILNISITSNLPATLIIRDISGKVIETATFINQTAISTTNYSSGMIFCEIWQGNERISTERIIVQH